MTDSPRREPFRIEIPPDVVDREMVPDDLDSTVSEPYAVPDVARRRRAGVVYVAAAVITAVSISAGLPAGMWIAVAGFVVVAAYHFAAGWRLRIGDGEALETANRATEFAVGHAAAALGFEGVLARPVWNVLVFSADDPPSRRGLVRVDAVKGTTLEAYVEDVPAGDS